MADIQELQQQLAEKEAHAAKLLDGIQGIEVQLGATSRFDPQTGQPMTPDAFNAWRYRASYARAQKLAEYRALKPEIYTLRSAITQEQTPPNEPLTTRERALLKSVADDIEACRPVFSDDWKQQHTVSSTEYDRITWYVMTLIDAALDAAPAVPRG